jgi:hypothetical protein
MADGSAVVFTLLRYLAFVVAAVVGPGVAVQRFLRLPVDTALVAPLGLTLCAATYQLSLIVAHPFLFPVAVCFLDAGLLWPRQPWRCARGPRFRGALPPFLVVGTLLALTQYPFNRIVGNGDFLLDAGEAPDTAFYVGVAWELAAGYPPQAPALAGIPMDYHLGPHLVRGAAARWARIHPYDAISRFDNTLLALALILVLRAAARALHAPAAAVALVSWAPLATDFSFLYAFHPGAHWWSFLCGSNLLHSLFFARSTIFALAAALGVIVAYGRYRAGEGRGWLGLAAFLALGLPFFNIFLASLILAGLGLAWLRASDRRALTVLGAATALGMASLVLQPHIVSPKVFLDPLGAVQRTQALLGLPSLSGPGLVAGGLLWLVAALGLRLFGLPRAFAALGSTDPPAVILATAALLGWPLRLLVHINADGRFDEAAYFAEHSGAILWIFTALALAPFVERSRSRVLVVATLAGLALPSTAEFVARKMALPPERIPARAVRAMRALEGASAPGSIVLVRPSAEYPPLPMVLIGRRDFYSEYMRSLLQFAPRAELQRRRALQRAFFRATDSQEALSLARQIGAEFLYLPAGEPLSFDPRPVAQPVYARDGERVYRFAAPASLDSHPASSAER